MAFGASLCTILMFCVSTAQRTAQTRHAALKLHQQEKPMSKQTKFVLSERDIPEKWYNIVADMP
ncbi:MAG: hypothetical protein ACK47M_19985, partial [Caldilinea sp.]